MPISEENKKLYPKDWKDIRVAILKRARCRCERCGVPNHLYGCRINTGPRSLQGAFVELPNQSRGRELHRRKIDWFKVWGINYTGMIMNDSKVIRIVLTIAHLDHDPTNNDPDNLAALCQRCHNKHDAKHRAATRKKKKDAK